MLKHLNKITSLFTLVLILVTVSGCSDTEEKKAALIKDVAAITNQRDALTADYDKAMDKANNLTLSFKCPKWRVKEPKENGKCREDAQKAYFKATVIHSKYLDNLSEITGKKRRLEHELFYFDKLHE